MDKISIRLNERAMSVEAGTTLQKVRQDFKPDADVVILNGFPFAGDAELKDGDEVVLIRRGKRPGRDELQALMVARHGPGLFEKVKSARVGIAGCGGLGSTLAVILARTGIGSLLLVDYDVVEPSNLNRQQFFIDQIGELKVKALAENLRRINPFVEIETCELKLDRANIPDVFRKCHVIAECFDNPHTKREMAVAVMKYLPEIPLVTVSGIAGFWSANLIKTRRVFQNVYLVGDTETAAQPGRGLLAPRVTVAAGHQANIILRILLGEGSSQEEGGDENSREWQD